MSTISLSNLYGFKGTVTLSASGAPTGTTAKVARSVYAQLHKAGCG